MDLVATIWDATKCLCNCTAKYAAFVCHLEDNLESLKEEWTQLQELSQDVMTRVQQAERNAHMRRTREVHGWLQRVNALEKEIDNIQHQRDKIVQVSCLDKFCQKNCFSSYNMGKEVVKTLNRVKELMDRGQKIKNDDNIAYEWPPELVDEMPLPKTVGMDLMLKKVWDSIEEGNVGIIGLYGMGGVGKTTLMKKLNNEFAKKNHDFALVIWVVVSKECDIVKIMEEIRQKCGIADINWKSKSKDEKVKEIYKVMKQKRFILLLDDIWKELELQSLGVPLPYENNQSKILFTTRYENVCDQMQAKKFKVECLTEEEAFNLFCIKVGKETLNSHRDIRALAQELVRECKGLPLALIIVGKAMATRKNPLAWRHAIKELKRSPSDVPDMEKEVFFTLKFSYDNLPIVEEKQCFLYCALYPEDQPIYIDDLIRFWIGEGFLREHNCIHDAYNHGEYIVESLKLACLLESKENDWVKMHDVIRDMALWLTRDQDQNKKTVLLQGEALELSQANDLENWLATKRISVMYDIGIAKTIEKDWYVPIFPHLETLIVQAKICIQNLANIQHMNKLTVLSLMGIEGISTLPTEIGLLIHLEYLELSRMCINERLPIEMKNLKSLMVFLLQYVDFSLEIIPLEVISSLEKLKVFSFFQNTLMNEKSSSQTMRSCAIDSGYTAEKSFLEQLELLPHLEDLSISLETRTGINKLLSSTKFQHCVTFLGLQKLTEINTPLISSMASMEHLEAIFLNGLEDKMEVYSFNCLNHFCKLHRVKIEDFHFITHLTWLKYAPDLLELIVRNCNLVEEVIKESDDDKGKENMDGLFSNLVKMRLLKLPNLRSIYKKALPFPMLQNFEILKCPKLKEIKGGRHWWHNLKSEDPTKENRLGRKVVCKMELLDDRVRKKVLKKAREISEIETISMDMKDSKLTVRGYIDPVQVVVTLRKLGHTELIFVGPATMEKNIELRKMIKRSQVTGK